ncbi:hypothetical protein PE36_09166 [Moritella sp. PE36]|uniref:tight adherence pilus pseudopilin TadF n=1 Tax=Moritella sp. PE36 TaxID=58051 RepID=UPI000156837B|nr:tight adherence pilus pseudopilin TadF [Moritella sp. PE36]EDM67640.1 hypothetical protein PE36_09166 [Moritella sp. PE36]
MLIKSNMRTLQRGSSVIELPVITFFMVILVLFIVRINQGISQKNQLDNLAYSLTSIVACERCDNTMLVSGSGSSTPTVKIISTELADYLLLVAQRHFNTLIEDSSAEIGLHVEQVVFDSSTQKSRLYDINAGAECLSRQRLLSLTDLSPIGTTPGLNAGQHAELFQVTLCIKGMSSIAEDFTPLFLLRFSDSFYQSSALLIGRAL